MNNGRKYPNWALWLWERGLTIFIATAAAVMVIGAALAYYFEGRLGLLDEREPARGYKEPNLDDYATEVSVDDATVEQSVYVPVYSHAYYDGGRPHLLETTLSIRNTDSTHRIYLRSVRYYDTQGKLIRTYVDRLIQLEPLQTVEFLVSQRETEGGSGANFIVDWFATEQVTEPLIEAVMIGVSGTRAFSFSREGRPRKVVSPAGDQ